ncbi:MAG: lysophospholipid acyltransferase family protein [Pseudomonadota bacterium]
MKSLWKRIRRYLVGSPTITGVLASVIAAYLRLVRDTNKLVRDDGPRVDDLLSDGAPLIFTCWHGQHLVIPFLTRDGEPSAMMVSRSADAELNARVVEKAGVEAVRGSGGRDGDKKQRRGGARALVALQKRLKEGRSVAFIGDVPKGTPREAGMGIITLARVSGRPIVPIAYATSRRHVVEGSWDKTTVNLPFGKSALCAGEPVHVSHNADDTALEAARLTLQLRLNNLTKEAYAAVDGDRRNTA